jgi:hypothetical protein
VSRRLPLIHALPQAIQEQVRTEVLSAHAAMKHLVPFARANLDAANQLAAAIAPMKPTCALVSVNGSHHLTRFRKSLY